MLEEIGLPYEPHLVDFGKDDQKTPEFLSFNPNGKIPAIIDPDGPGGRPLGLFASGAILQYLGEKTGKLLPVADVSMLRWVRQTLINYLRRRTRAGRGSTSSSMCRPGSNAVGSRGRRCSAG